jgi:hypothetical protein
MILDCVLSCRSWLDTLVASRLLSNLSLLILWIEIGHLLCLGVDIGYGRCPSGQNTTWWPQDLKT